MLKVYPRYKLLGCVVVGDVLLHCHMLCNSDISDYSFKNFTRFIDFFNVGLSKKSKNHIFDLSFLHFTATYNFSKHFL